MTTIGTISYYSDANWKQIPAPSTASTDEKSKWTQLPADEKMGKLINKAVEENPSQSSKVIEVILDNCWQAEELKSGFDILKIAREYLKITHEPSQTNDRTITIVFSDEGTKTKLELPYSYKPALAKDSSYFEKLFYSPLTTGSKQDEFLVSGLTKADFKKLIEHWSDETKIENNLQAAYDSLMVGNVVNLLRMLCFIVFISIIRVFSIVN